MLPLVAQSRQTSWLKNLTSLVSDYYINCQLSVCNEPFSKNRNKEKYFYKEKYSNEVNHFYFNSNEECYIPPTTTTPHSGVRVWKTPIFLCNFTRQKLSSSPCMCQCSTNLVCQFLSLEQNAFPKQEQQQQKINELFYI